jgi:uncharacterized membrane protein YfcA
MNCFISGLFGVGLLGASIATNMTSKEQTDKLKSVLSPELAIKYDKIIKERTTHYIQGLLIGMLLAYIILLNYNITNRFHRISLFFGITLFSTALYYLLMPKSDYMLNHLKTKEENQAWLSVYKTMNYRYLIGFVLGALAAIPLGNVLC